MLPDELVAKFKCAPGAVGTALDVNIDSTNPQHRWCGMCAVDSNDKTLGDVCPRCGHRFDYYQIMTEASALGNGGSLRNKQQLAAFIKRRNEKLKREEYYDQFDPME